MVSKVILAEGQQRQFVTARTLTEHSPKTHPCNSCEDPVGPSDTHALDERECTRRRERDNERTE